MGEAVNKFGVFMLFKMANGTVIITRTVTVKQEEKPPQLEMV